MEQKTTLAGVGRLAAAVLLAGMLVLGGSAAAQALPPDGPGPETPGTSSRVWPAEVKAGDRLNFEVSGYPANETVYIKIDDGTMCTDTSHGACVYATQKLDGNGYAKGSIIVPALAPGAHWLRMLATGDVFDSETGEKIGYEGYTRRGGNDFTVVAGGSAAAPVVGDKGGSAAPGGGAVNADGTIESGSVALDLGAEAATPTPEPTETAAVADEPVDDQAESDPGVQAAGADNPTTAAAEPELPVVGIGVLAGAVVLGGAVLTWAVVRRNRLVKAAASANDAE